MTKLVDPSTEQHIPHGHELSGVSSLVTTDGKATARWIKTRQKRVAPEELTKVYRDALKLVRSPRKAGKAPEVESDQLLSMYLFGDPHFGLLSWAVETGQDFDLKICAERHRDVALRLISHAPDSERAVMATLGDGLHSDGYSAQTTAGTKVDVDTRFPKALRAHAAFEITATELLLQKHAQVTRFILRGNHDTTAALSVAEILRAHFRNEPRVTIKDNVPVHSYGRWHSNLFGFTHGDKGKAKDLPLLMATDRPALWGATRNRKFFVGHVHHSDKKEYPGCIVEHYPTLASQDAWHAGQGYRARQGACVEVYHAQGGQVAKYEVTL